MKPAKPYRLEGDTPGARRLSKTRSKYLISKIGHIFKISKIFTGENIPQVEAFAGLVGITTLLS